MRRITIGIVFLMVVAACGDGDGGATTTSSPIETTTTGASTSSSVASTTSTVPETTTTSPETTTTQVTGNWADEPLVVSQYGALGWWDGANWVQVDELTSLPVSGGEDYQVVLLGTETTITGGPEEILCEPLNNLGVELSDTSVLGGPFPDPVGVAISAPWELTPHFVQEEDDDGTYSAFARPLLATRGIDVDNPVIKQVVRFDLDGDGVNEVIAVAEDVSGPGNIYAAEGDYSLVFMRRAVDGEVQTAILGESIVTDLAEGETPFILTHVVAAIADLSGDGKMEIVINEVYYEGAGWSVWEYVNDDLGPVLQIQSGCGV